MADLGTNPGLKDRMGRPCHDLRISVTNRCQFRCRYCLPAEHVDVMRSQSASENKLSFDDITRIVEAYAELGVNKVRLTGGEPLLRKHLPQLVKSLKSIKGIDDLAMTTNGILLPQILDDLIKAGLDRVTISLDAIDDDLFAHITGTQHRAKDVLDVIDLCLASRLKQVKINTVIQKGINEHQVVPILEHFRGTAAVVRFIEFMDVGTLNQWHETQVMPSHAVLDLIAQHRPFHSKHPLKSGEVAKRYGFDDGQEEFGLISSVSQPFCGDCDRARLSSDGLVFQCLFASQGHDTKPHLDDPVALKEHINQWWQHRDDQYSVLRQKKDKHHPLPKIEMFVMGG